MGKIWNNIRRWTSMLFGKKKTVEEITGSKLIDEEHYSNLQVWRSVYGGHYDKWHDITVHTINGRKKQKLYKLNMAKVSVEELSKLIFTEQVEINIDNEEHGELIRNVLEENRFYKVFQGKVEQMLALGGLVLKVNPKELPDGSHELEITYVTPDSFIPLSHKSGEVTEGVFLNVSKKGGKTYCLFEFHEWVYMRPKGKDDKEYVLRIKNELHESDGLSGESKKVPLTTLDEHKELEPISFIENLEHPLFVYIKPNIANNRNLQSPLGLSIFANSLDTLHAIDQVYDSFVREIRLGKRRILLPHTATKTIVDPLTGKATQYFDADDEVYQAVNYAEPDKQKIVDNTVEIRAQEHIDSINMQLDVLSMQLGFSAGTFVFDGRSIKTATEVMSEKDKTFRTKQANEELIEEGLRKFIYILSDVADLYDIFPKPEKEYNVDFHWDDSIIQDKDANADFNIKLQQSGLVTKAYALSKILDMTEEEAVKMIQAVIDEKASELPDLNDMTDIEDRLGDVE